MTYTELVLLLSLAPGLFILATLLALSEVGR
jgi:hypothetical protein